MVSVGVLDIGPSSSSRCACDTSGDIRLSDYGPWRTETSNSIRSCRSDSCLMRSPGLAPAARSIWSRWRTSAASAARRTPVTSRSRRSSAQVAQAERQLGVQVFERDRRRVRVSAAGAAGDRAGAAASWSPRTISTELARQVGRSVPRRRCGSASFPPSCPYLLPEVTPALARAFPDLTMRLDARSGRARWCDR